MSAFLSRLAGLADVIGTGYASILFGQSAVLGYALLAITMIVPAHGLTGLAGAGIAFLLARWFGFGQGTSADGRLIANPALAALLLAWWMPCSAENWTLYLGLLVLISGAALVLTVLLNHYSLLLNGVPALSLPFWCVGAGLHWFLVERGYASVGLTASAPSAWPEMLQVGSQSLGEISFTGLPWAGLLVALLLLASSRLHLLHALVGFAISWLLLGSFGFAANDCAWLHLNCILCAIALGGVFYTPSRGALLLAAFGSGLCAALGLALLRVLPLLDVPILTLPFILTTLGLVSALRWREAGGALRPVLFAAKNPEAAFRGAQLYHARHPEAELPRLAPPFDGEWVVTQGFDGDITHRGPWRYALDFEVADLSHARCRPQSPELLDYPSFNAPVVSPAAGRIVHVVDDVEDNPIGRPNLAQNWGNLVVIEIAPQLHVLLCHFRRGGLKVREGERVRAGQLLGYLGNSGRSPVPHLHLQMQHSAEVGAPTIPFRLRNYRTPAKEGTGERLHFSGLPRENDSLSGCRAVRWLTQTAAHWAGEEQTCRVITADGETLERIALSAEAYGVLCWRSLDHRCEFRAQILDGIFTPLAYEGNGPSVLRLLWLVGRLPLCPANGLQWEEAIDPAWDAPPLLRVFRDLVAPFAGGKPPVLRGRIVRCDPDRELYQIACSIPGRPGAPSASSLELIFGRGLRLVSIRQESATSWLRSFPAQRFPGTQLEEGATLPAQSRSHRPLLQLLDSQRRF